MYYLSESMANEHDPKEEPGVFLGVFLARQFMDECKTMFIDT